MPELSQDLITSAGDIRCEPCDSDCYNKYNYVGVKWREWGSLPGWLRKALGPAHFYPRRET